jgi:host factor-I protein
MNLQDVFLALMRRENQMVVIYLVNGFQIKGIVRAYDNFTIFVETAEGKLQLIYKHAVTTINPLKNVSADFLWESLKKNSEILPEPK